MPGTRQAVSAFVRGFPILPRLFDHLPAGTGRTAESRTFSNMTPQERAELDRLWKQHQKRIMSETLAAVRPWAIGSFLVFGSWALASWDEYTQLPLLEMNPWLYAAIVLPVLTGIMFYLITVANPDHRREVTCYKCNQIIRERFAAHVRRGTHDRWFCMDCYDEITRRT